jgi:NADH-quinone oxidoreductase subunit J
VTFESFFFLFVALCAITTAVLMVWQRNPVMSAIYLIANFFCIATLYLLLRAQLLAVLQIVVYTGAIMVLVIFVIMLLNLGDEQTLKVTFNVRRAIGVAFVVAFLMEMVYVFGFAPGTEATGLAPNAEAIGEIGSMGRAMFGRFLLPFEMAGMILLAAIIGAVVLARRKVTGTEKR